MESSIYRNRKSIWPRWCNSKLLVIYDCVLRVTNNTLEFFPQLRANLPVAIQQTPLRHVPGRLRITLVPIQVGQFQIYPGVFRLHPLRSLQQPGGFFIITPQARLPA